MEIVISRNRLIEIMETLNDAEPEEGFFTVCLLLSLIYRSTLEASDPSLALTITDFTDEISKQVSNLITNPPPEFKFTPPTPGCDCEVCVAKRRRLSRAH